MIGLTMGEGESNPQLALGLIFSVIGIFGFVLLLLQRADLEHVPGGDATGRSRAAAEGGGPAADNPAALSESGLWAALATGPIEVDAVQAQAEMWDVGRRVKISFGGHEDARHREVAVAEPCRAFEATSKRVEVRSGPDGVVVSRRKAGQGDWLCDLWLAQRLASG
ncbi:MAG TPA: hypothetical protein VKB23_12425 [Solirubrobacterales bacterium]|nr:hypothetical protein [Solirubrobacterales bacterium]